ncbi:hypothetical protein PsorP6_000298 [Peronosclerospora sorghi]|uniref:Uncharacterized protein n=1 Tax=Peronosclerospora sorghi TaxID=230839 RepID=A0ACC0WVY0_9STRA|nr:hypothetical protein PsorP6_000298 [Peronosclerospora sorghi]
MVSFLAKRFKHQDAFLGVGLLNEPSSSTTKEVLYDYYKRAYEAVRVTGSNCVVTIARVLTEQTHDAEWQPHFLWSYDHATDVDLVQIVKKTSKVAWPSGMPFQATIVSLLASGALLRTANSSRTRNCSMSLRKTRRR